jgi:hypothetical protein
MQLGKAGPQRHRRAGARAGENRAPTLGPSFRPAVNGATGVSDMAGKAARVAVEPSGSERDTTERLG